MARRLSESGRAELEAKRERLQLELRLVTATLRSDEAMKLQERLRPASERPRLQVASATLRQKAVLNYSGVPRMQLRQGAQFFDC